MSLFRNPPETRFADTGNGMIGYQLLGDGPPDIFHITQLITNVDAMWDSPHVASYFDRLSALGRVVVSEYRGIGVSDPFPFDRNPTFDEMLVDIWSVLDAAGIERATLIGDTEAGPMTMLAAASYPERIERLVLVNTYARLIRDADYPIGMTPEVADQVIDFVKQTWGRRGFFNLTAPSHAADEGLQDWLARYERLVASPLVIERFFDWFSGIDVRSVLGSIAVPALIIVRSDGVYHRPDFGRFLADHIPNSKLVELPGADTAPYFLADPGPVLAEIEEFMTGEKTVPVTDRVLATVMFTDIVDSTGRLAKLGDQRWLDLLDRHNVLARQYVSRFGGSRMNTTGDGIVAIFDGPTRAVTCAAQLQDAVAAIGLEIRVGLHVGEVELMGREDVGGLAVHIASRVMAEESGSGVLVSSTVKDLVIGSGIEFDSVGSHELKGVPGEWSLFELKSVPSSLLLTI